LENNCDQTSHTYLGLTGQFEDGHIRCGLKIYDVETKFVIILVDGIGVKKQSQSRVSSISAKVLRKKQ